MQYPSWGLWPVVKVEKFKRVFFEKLQGVFISNDSLLPRGLGRSYGDSCLNEGDVLLLTLENDRFISFDESTGLLTCQSGVSFDEILKVFVPKGWFLPVTPGTKYVTVGGAIANDVHGKNHHSVGNFGHFVKSFRLVRSDGFSDIVSKESHPDLFRATIGGLGLTGLITEVSFYLKKISSAYIDQEQIQFTSLNEFFLINEQTEKQGFEYTVAWVDCVNGQSLRGIYIRGNHARSGDLLPHKASKLDIPIYFPKWVLNKLSISLFNHLYYFKNIFKFKKNSVHYDPFFYPLDSIRNWNRIYGRSGFFQYQLVVPMSQQGRVALDEVFSLFKKNGAGSFLAVLKTFGEIESLGMMSFPQKGITLALDFANKPGVTELFKQCDAIVANCGGRLYPAKDANMSAENFKKFYPGHVEFSKYRDQKLASSFSRRVQL